MTVNDSVMTAIESTKLIKDEKQRVKLVNEIVNQLDLAGWITTDNDHLAMMRALLQRNHKAAMDPECSTRDLAAVTIKIQTLSREVFTLEERAKQEAKQSNGRSKSGTTATGTAFDGSTI